jgi:phosphoenolpyruvate-protein kinase (PTS system EI component)
MCAARSFVICRALRHYAPHRTSVVCAVDLSPLDVLHVSRGRVVGFVLEHGAVDALAALVERRFEEAVEQKG